MVALGTLLAVVTFVLPVVGFVALRLRTNSRPWEVALDIPIAIVADLLLVLTLCHFVRLETATFVTRAVYPALFAGWAAFKRRRNEPVLAWPDAIRGRDVAKIVLVAVIALGISLVISRRYSIWDRNWHIPLVAAIRGQRLPFHNIYDPRQILRYHFSGNVHAAMLQALSRTTIHSALALSLEHDIQFTFMGIVLALLLLEWSYRNFLVFLLAPLALLLNGPVTLMREGNLRPDNGYSISNYLSLSCRPHAALAGLLLLAFTGVVGLRAMSSKPPPAGKTTLALLACAAGLSIADETSLGLSGLVLGLCWLVAPSIVHPKRLPGIFVFAGLLVALVLPNVAFSAALSPGGEHHAFSLVPWRSPGFYTATLPLSTERGVRMLVFDMFVPGLMAIAAATFTALRPSRGRALFLAFTVLLFGISLVALTRLDMDGVALEMHRFVTATVFLAPFLTLAIFGDPSWDGAASRRSPSPGGRVAYVLAAFVGGLGAACGAITTVGWFFVVLPSIGQRPRSFSSENHYTLNCRDLVGSTIGTEPNFTYLSPSLWYLVSGCRPVFAPGVPTSQEWKSLLIGLPRHYDAALAELREQAPPGSTFPGICASDLPEGERDPICTFAESLSPCRPLSPRLKECRVSPEVLEAFRK